MTAAKSGERLYSFTRSEVYKVYSQNAKGGMATILVTDPNAALVSLGNGSLPQTELCTKVFVKNAASELLIDFCKLLSTKSTMTQIEI